MSGVKMGCVEKLAFTTDVNMYTTAPQSASSVMQPQSTIYRDNKAIDITLNSNIYKVIQQKQKESTDT